MTYIMKNLFTIRKYLIFLLLFKKSILYAKVYFDLLVLVMRKLAIAFIVLIFN